MPLNIVLFEPEIPQNTGNIARTCAAIGAHLHLVHPLGFSIEDRQLKRAGLDYWHLLSVKQWESVDEFLNAHCLSDLWFFTTKAPSLYCKATYSNDSFFIFGKESAGIPESVLVRYPQQCVRIPMIDQARSLNLSDTVAIAAYEYERQHEFSGLQITGQLHTLTWPETVQATVLQGGGS